MKRIPYETIVYTSSLTNRMSYAMFLYLKHLFIHEIPEKEGRKGSMEKLNKEYFAVAGVSHPPLFLCSFVENTPTDFFPEYLGGRISFYLTDKKTQ